MWFVMSDKSSMKVNNKVKTENTAYRIKVSYCAGKHAEDKRGASISQIPIHKTGIQWDRAKQ